MMLAQFNPTPQPAIDTLTTERLLSATPVHDRTEAFALMEELKKRQRPFEKLRVAQAHEEKYRAEVQAVDGLLDTLDSIALAETEDGVIPPAERVVLKKSLHQALQSTTSPQENNLGSEAEADETIDLEDLKKLLFYPGIADSPLHDKSYLVDLGTIIAQKLAEQLQHQQLAQQAFGLNPPTQEKLVLCKYLQQLLDEVQKLRSENSTLKTELQQYQPAGLGLYKKAIKKV
jgi:hypothetical protein